MGKEWYWGGSRSTNSKRGGVDKDTTSTTPSGCMSAVFQFFDFHHFQFPLHQHQPSFKPNSLNIPEDHTILKGVEAPRNSLELEATPLSSTSFKEEENLNISMGIQIKTSKGDTRSKVGSAPTDSSSEISSPGAKTPNLVARLMGLDLLPDSHSPSSSSFSSFHDNSNLLAKSNLHHHLRPSQPLQNKSTSHRKSIDVHVTGTRSLPETPRISSARRSDVDHHRLSLQINKENIGVGEELDFSRFSYLRRKELKQEDEYRSPSHYARQIVKQVKESVNRKVGLDITNTLRNREQTRDDMVSQLKAKKCSRTLTNVVDQSSPGKHSTPSCSPRLSRFLESKQKPVTTSTTPKDHIPHQPRKQSFPPSSQVNNQPQPIRVLSSKPKLQPVQEHQHHEQRPAKKCKKAASERFSPRLKKPPQTSDIIRNKQEEPFVRPSTTNRTNNPDKKCKKTPLSNGLLNITVPTLLPVKKDPSSPATKIPQTQVLNAQSSKRNSQLSSNSSQTYKQDAMHTLIARDSNDDRANGVTTTTVGGAAEYEFEYVTRILRRTGIDKHTPVSFTNWFSPSHPLNPCIFHHLENNITTFIVNPYNHPSSKSNPLTHQCNRKLLFYLVDEILVDILKPLINMKPWTTSYDYGSRHMHMQGSELIEKLCVHIKSFPCADCRVLEDIDAIIEKDMPQTKEQSAMAFEEEGEGLVMEIEKDILDTLIHETAVELGVGFVRN